MYLQVISSIIIIFILIRKGEELKAPYNTSTTAIYNYITTRNIVPTLAILFL